MLISCAVFAAGRHLKKNDVIEYIGIFLCVIWVINFVIVCFRAMTGVQDEMIEWSHNGEENRVIGSNSIFCVYGRCYTYVAINTSDVEDVF